MGTGPAPALTPEARDRAQTGRMHDLVAQCEAATDRADRLAVEVQAHIDAGRSAPVELLQRLAVAEDAVLMMLVSLQHARGPSGHQLH